VAEFWMVVMVEPVPVIAVPAESLPPESWASPCVVVGDADQNASDAAGAGKRG
jgi:hypothetical protein